MTDIHDELNRLVLRKRWIKWSLRNHKPGDYRTALPAGKHIVLSARLSRFKPTWEQRHKHDPVEDELESKEAWF